MPTVTAFRSPAALAKWVGLAPGNRHLRAAVIVAHSIVVDLGYILFHQQLYADLGVDYFDRRDQEQVRRQAVKRLEALGYRVTLTAAS